jgi:hypothetical protein
MDETIAKACECL